MFLFFKKGQGNLFSYFFRIKSNLSANSKPNVTAVIGVRPASCGLYCIIRKFVGCCGGAGADAKAVRAIAMAVRKSAQQFLRGPVKLLSEKKGAVPPFRNRPPQPSDTIFDPPDGVDILPHTCAPELEPQQRS